MSRLNMRVKMGLGYIAAVCGVALMLLASCSRLDALDDARAFADVAVDASRVRNRVIGDPVLDRPGLPGTQFEAVPTSGSATFKGASFVAVTSAGSPDESFALVGRSDVTVDFGPGRDNISGTMNDFQSSREGEGILDVSGQLTLRNGIVGAESPNRFTVGYNGAVTVDGTPYEMSGDMQGRFRGTRTELAAGQSPVRALSAVDINGSVRSGAEQFVGRATIIAEN